MEGLENRLKGVEEGDLILLKSEKGLTVCGYVSGYDKEKITLSTTNPQNREILVDTSLCEWINVCSPKSSRNYRLKYFDDYKILIKQGE